ncbi:MAG: SEC-C domain-containing protein, partial [Treponema sp.]|nr:SEC-C domain-containing protein [Treponema sp.]
LQDAVYKTKKEKYKAVIDAIVEAHAKGQPVLVGTITIETSELLSNMLSKRGVKHNVLNAKFHEQEAQIVADAGKHGAVTIATNMAGRGTDIKLGGNPEMRARKRAGTQATKEQYEEALAIEKEQWKKDYEEVKNLGGLYVIGSERHESRRIDNQLRGRSGRQGDPGRSKFYISMDDDLMRLFGGERMKSIMTRIGMEPGEPIDHPMLNRGIERAQHKVEERNFEIRKHLLDYDDVLNEQRSVIYEQRDAILADNDLSGRVFNNAKDFLTDLFGQYGRKGNEKEIGETVKSVFGLALPPERLNIEAIESELQNDITQKETLVGKENLNMFIRYQYVQTIDKKWLDQLEFLEALREAVSLRSYGSKNPLTEYKIDGFNQFYDTLDSIRQAIISRLFKTRIQLSPEALAQRQRQQEMARMSALNARHDESGQNFGASGQQAAGASSFDGDAARRQAAGGAMQKSRQGASVTVRRTIPKVGRNDPCPCGSGKKYKQCHGRTE